MLHTCRTVQYRPAVHSVHRILRILNIGTRRVTRGCPRARTGPTPVLTVIARSLAPVTWSRDRSHHGQKTSDEVFTLSAVLRLGLIRPAHAAVRHGGPATNDRFGLNITNRTGHRPTDV